MGTDKKFDRIASGSTTKGPNPLTLWERCYPNGAAVPMPYQCSTFGAAVTVMTSGPSHPSQDLQSRFLVARPRPPASCLALCTTVPVSPTHGQAVGHQRLLSGTQWLQL
mmetsp:Transcript_85446/g.142299  ORF Transcript_85446/g.142299 Transcript_85446/m.142299 type:complete len:109 (+) Transcript_85446:541-867(+)